MKSPLIVKLEGAIAFLIPFLTTFTAASFVTNLTFAQLIQIIAAALVAGLSGLKSFLSTTFSDSLPDAPPVTPSPISSAAPETKPAATAAQPNP